MLENSNDCKVDDDEVVEAVEAHMTDQQRTPGDAR